MEEDKINNPKHYTSHPSGIECIEISEHHNFCIGNAIKYLWRAGLKADAGKSGRDKLIEDLEKAVWYIQREIKRIKKPINIKSMNLDRIEYSAHFTSPFGVFSEDEWGWISDNSDSEEYALLDHIFRYLTGEISRETLTGYLPEDIAASTDEGLKKLYDKRFPVLFGKALQQIGKQFENGELPMCLDYQPRIISE